VPLAETSADFLANNNPSQGWRDNCVAPYTFQLGCQLRAELRRNISVLKDQSTLKILPAM
jgi:hypothetical protein